jgi:DNA polymerase
VADPPERTVRRLFFRCRRRDGTTLVEAVVAILSIDLESVDPATLPEVGLRASRAGADRTELARLAARCRACALWERASQTVFGEGPRVAPLVLVGEQPGDQEDRAGHPFVGPAGRILDDALARAGIDREKAFVTNVVKHFKWKPVPGTKRRLHDRPNAVEVRACRPWLDAELQLVGPEALVLLGATAAQSVLGPGIRVSETAGRLFESDLASIVVATLHPSAVLRARSENREPMFARLVGDLELVANAAR